MSFHTTIIVKKIFYFSSELGHGPPHVLDDFISCLTLLAKHRDGAAVRSDIDHRQIILFAVESIVERTSQYHVEYLHISSNLGLSLEVGFLDFVNCTVDAMRFNVELRS